MIVRYFCVLLLGFGNLYLLYFVLTPITTFVFYLLISLFMNTNFVGNEIVVGNYFIEIVRPCVAAAGYYLLFVLGMTTKMKLFVRFKSIITAFGIFFGFNIIRLVFLTFFVGNPSFELIHLIFWHFVSTVFVVVTWLIVIKIYKIKGIPVYSDLLYVKRLERKKPKRKK